MCKSDASWDRAIYDAEQKIAEASSKISDLKRAVRAFKALRDNGEPFPGAKPYN